MEMTHLNQAAVAAALAFGAISATAQDGPLRGTVNVDGKYLPDVIRQDRVNTLPRLYSFNIESMTLDYDRQGVVAPFAPSFSALPVTGWQTQRNIRDYNGYVSLNLGSWLNSSLSAGYRPLHSATDDLAVWLQHNSTSLFKPKTTAWSEKIKQERYDEVIGIDYAHTFADAGRLDFGLNYHLGYFNYYGFTGPVGLPADAPDAQPIDKAPTQTVNDFYAALGWNTLPGSELQYDAKVGVRYFGYRRLYMFDPATPTNPLSLKGEKETHVDIDGGVGYTFDGASTVGVRLRGDYLGYDEPLWRGESIDSYGRFGLTPYYRFCRGNLDLHLGAALDFTFDAGPKDERFGTFHVAPDVRLDYKAGIAGLYLHAGGGTHLNTLADQAAADYYGIPALLSTNPSYIPLDGKIGINFGPMAGVTAGVAFAYKYINHQPMLGLYTMYLNRTQIAGLADGEVANPLYADGMKVHGWSLQANIGFEISRKVNIGLNGSYQPQKGETGYWNGIDRPRWLLDASASFRPIDPLNITLQYTYRGVRNVYTHVTRTSGAPSGNVTGDAYDGGFKAIRLPDVTDLALRASYNITPAFSVTLQADNLLNHHIQLLPDVTSQGINIMGGVQLTF